jgi:hypothetical protein
MHAHSDWTRSSVHGAIVIHPIEGTTYIYIYIYPKPNNEEIFVLSTLSFMNHLSSKLSIRNKKKKKKKKKRALGINISYFLIIVK